MSHLVGGEIVLVGTCELIACATQTLLEVSFGGFQAPLGVVYVYACHTIDTG